MNSAERLLLRYSQSLHPNLLLFKSRETKFATKIGFVATTAVTGPSTDEYSIYVAPEYLKERLGSVEAGI